MKVLNGWDAVSGKEGRAFFGAPFSGRLGLR